MSNNVSLQIEQEFSPKNAHKQIQATLGDLTLVGLLTEDFGLDLNNDYGANDENLFGDTAAGRALQGLGNTTKKLYEKASDVLGTDRRVSKESALQHWQDSKRWSFSVTFTMVNTSKETRNMAKLKKAIKLVLPTRAIDNAGARTLTQATLGQVSYLAAPAGYGVSSWTAATSTGEFTGTWSVRIGKYMQFKNLVCPSLSFKLSKERSRLNGEPIWIQITMQFEPANLPTAEDVDGWFSV